MSTSLANHKAKLADMARDEPLARQVMMLIHLGDTPEEAFLKGLIVAIESNAQLRRYCIDLQAMQPKQPMLRQP